MESYFTASAPRPPENTIYDDFIRYCQITRSSVSYMEQKVLHSIDVLVLYDKLRKATYPMKTHLCDLDLDNMTLQEAKHKMRLAVGIQKEVEKSYLTYFKDHGSLKSDDAMTHPHMTQAWTAGFHFEPKLVIENIRHQMRNGTLHLSCCALQDPTFHQWEDVVMHNAHGCHE